MNVSPRQLRMFLALSESLSFSRTAEQFFLTQPSLSKAIRDLEAELSLRLFERTTRSVQLTEAGERLATLARGVIGEFDAGLARMRMHAERAVRQVSLAALPSLAQVLLPAACAALEKHHGNELRITIHDGANARAIERLVHHEVDFALASVSPSHPDVHYEEVLRDRFVLLSAGRWASRVGARIGLDEMADLPLISMTAASTAMRYMSAAYLQRGVEFRPKMQFDQVGTIVSFVKEGLGVAVLPYLATLPLLTLRGLHVSEISDGPVRSIGLATRRAGQPTEIAQKMMAAIRTVAGTLCAGHPEGVLPPARRRRKAVRETPAK